MSSSSAAPSKQKATIKSNDAMRGKIRELLQEALSRVSGETDEDIMDEVNACDPIRVAVTVESVLFEKWVPSNGAQKVTYRSLMFNQITQISGEKVPLGYVKPRRLINMTTEEMPQRIKRKALVECECGVESEATTDQFNIFLYIYLIVFGSISLTSDPLAKSVTQCYSRVDHWVEFYNYGLYTHKPSVAVRVL